MEEATLARDKAMSEFISEPPVKAEAPATDASGERLLLVVPPGPPRATLESSLGSACAEVRCTADGIEALHALFETGPGRVLIDRDTEGLDAYQFTALLRTMKRFRSLRVIMLSDGVDILVRARARAVGIDKVLGKPFSRDELFKALELPGEDIATADAEG